MATRTRDSQLAMLLYYITDRRQFAGSPSQQRRRLLDKIAEAAGCGVDFIQLREKDLTTRELEQLAKDAVEIVREASAGRERTGKGRPETCLLINSRTDVALATGADGVHLRSDDLAASDVRALWAKAAATGDWKPASDNCIIAVSCHRAGEVRLAEAQGADFAVFAPVFEKSGCPGAGLGALRAACLAPTAPAGPELSAASHFPVLALGGVGLDNARACIDAGASGIAAIRLFQENDLAQVLAALRILS